MTTLSEKLKELRKNSNFTQVQVANSLGINRSTYSYYESGRTTPSFAVLEQLAKLFHVSMTQLINSEISAQQIFASSPSQYELSAEKSLPYSRLTENEKDLLLTFRQLDESGRQELSKRSTVLRDRLLNQDE